jgi:glycosyltransferase involved in cell wall biosynthesis
MSKVLFLCDIALENPRRGTPIHVARLLQELRAQHELTVCAASVPDALRDIFVPYPRDKGFAKLRMLVRIVRAYKPRAIFTIGQTGLLAPVILKYVCGARIVVELQGVEYIEKYAMGHISLPYYYFWKFKSMLLLPFFDVVIAFSRRTASLYPLLQRVAIIFPGIDIDTVPQVMDYKEIPPLVVGYAGNTDAYQGLEHLVEAVALVRGRGLDARLRLVLTGDDGAVREKIAECGLVEVATITRNVSHQEAMAEMMQVTALAIPRPSMLEAVYGFPSKLPECLALGLPVVVTNVGAVPELMPALGEHAIVISSEDVTRHLADALERIARMSPQERMRRGEAARAYAQRFGWEHATKIASDTQ